MSNYTKPERPPGVPKWAYIGAECINGTGQTLMWMEDDRCIYAGGDTECCTDDLTCTIKYLPWQEMHALGVWLIEQAEIARNRQQEEGSDSDVISTVIRADAEAARAEIRAADVVCPSCETNMADLPSDHKLETSSGRKHETGPDGAIILARQPQIAKCASGQAVELTDDSGAPIADFETIKAIANINLWNTYNQGIDVEWSEMLKGNWSA